MMKLQRVLVSAFWRFFNFSGSSGAVTGCTGVFASAVFALSVTFPRTTCAGSVTVAATFDTVSAAFSTAAITGAAVSANGGCGRTSSDSRAALFDNGYAGIAECGDASCLAWPLVNGAGDGAGAALSAGGDTTTNVDSSRAEVGSSFVGASWSGAGEEALSEGVRLAAFASFFSSRAACAAFFCAVFVIFAGGASASLTTFT
jgi:hypothetical protein